MITEEETNLIDPITMNTLARMRHQDFIEEAARDRRFANEPRQSLRTIVRRFAAPVVNAIRPSAVQETRVSAPVLAADPCLEPCP